MSEEAPMTWTERILAIQRELHHPPERGADRLVHLMKPVVDLLRDGGQHVPLDIFEVMDNQARMAALAGFIQATTAFIAMRALAGKIPRAWPTTLKTRCSPTATLTSR